MHCVFGKGGNLQLRKYIFLFFFFSLLTLAPSGIGHRNIKISGITHLASCFLSYCKKKKKSIKILPGSCNCALPFFRAFFFSLPVTRNLLALGNLILHPFPNLVPIISKLIFSFWKFPNFEFLNFGGYERFFINLYYNPPLNTL